MTIADILKHKSPETYYRLLALQYILAFNEAAKAGEALKEVILTLK